MKRKTLLNVLGISLCALPLFAQAAAEPREQLEMKYDWGASENQSPTAFSGTCPVHIAPPEDLRQNKETIGRSMKGALLSGDTNRWIADGLGNLKSYGFTVDEAPNTGAGPRDGILVRTSLTRAYTWQIGLKIFSMVALKVKFVDKNGVLQEKYYRAHGDKTNMWGADSEYVTTLNYGLNNMLPVVAKDLVSLCKGVKVETYTYSGPESPEAK